MARPVRIRRVSVSTNKNKKITRAEDALHIDIVGAVSGLLKPGAVLFHVPNQGKRKVQYREKLRRMGLRAGVADLQIIHDGRVYFLEIKTKTGRPSPAQILFRRDAEGAGAFYAIVRSIDEAINQLCEWGLTTAVSVFSPTTKTGATLGNDSLGKAAVGGGGKSAERGSIARKAVSERAPTAGKITGAGLASYRASAHLSARHGSGRRLLRY